MREQEDRDWSAAYATPFRVTTIDGEKLPRFSVVCSRKIGLWRREYRVADAIEVSDYVSRESW